MLGKVRVGNPLQYETLTVYPLFTQPAHAVEYRLSDDALASGLVTVEEVSQEGSVPELMVENRSDTRVLFVQGEELIGAKQNRVLNTSVLVAARSRTRIPVSCVERKRWRYKSQGFQSGGSYSSSALRRILAGSVHRSLRANRGHTSDQREVWKEVERQQGALGVASETCAMADTYRSQEDGIRQFRKHLGYVGGASGMAVAIGNRLVAVDIFDKPATCQKVWSGLLSGSVLDALEKKPSAGSTVLSQVDRALSLLRQGPREEIASVGEGEEYRAETCLGDDIFELCLGGTTIHASVIAGNA